MASTDLPTQINTAIFQLGLQIFSSFSYNSQRHPLVAPDEIPGLKYTSHKAAQLRPDKEDTLPERNPYPLQPAEKDEFEESQRELSEDLITKAKQIQELIARLPTIERGEEEEMEEIRNLSEQVRQMKREEKAQRREMRRLLKRLDAVVGGMSSSIDHGHAARG